jgi:hypothetical protein
MKPLECPNYPILERRDNIGQYSRESSRVDWDFKKSSFLD